MNKLPYYLVNGITLYRLIMAPILLCILFLGGEQWYIALLAISFATDLIDGYLARKFSVESKWGSRLDSIADYFTIIVAIAGLFYLKYSFILTVSWILYILVGLFVLQSGLAIYKYGKLSSFHTYGAKAASILLGVFLFVIFFFPNSNAKLLYGVFYIQAVVMVFELVEEIILVMLLPNWEPDVKGLFWVLKRNQRKQNTKG